MQCLLKSGFVTPDSPSLITKPVISPKKEQTWYNKIQYLAPCLATSVLIYKLIIWFFFFKKFIVIEGRDGILCVLFPFFFPVFV